MHPQSWIPARVDALTALWLSSLGAEEIAQVLIQRFPDARPISGDAVQKKAKAMNLPARPRTANGAAKPVKRAIMHRGAGFGVLRDGDPKKPMFIDDTLDLATIPHEQRCQIVDLDSTKCRWPIGEPGTKSFFFCGGRALTGKVYCRCHHIRSLPR